MSSLSQDECFCGVLDLLENLFTFELFSQRSKLILILVSHSVHFSRHKWDLVGIIVMRKKIIVFLKNPKIETCFDRFRKQFVIFFTSFLEHFEGQSEIWNFYFEFWRKLNIFIVFDICFIIGRLSWDQRK